MIPHFLGRCPPPQITPKSIIDTCHLYCLYQPVSKIAKTVVLLESQVIQIQQTCPICTVSDVELKKICNLHFCEGQNSTTVEKNLEIPLPTVKFVIANNCSGCQIDDPVLKKAICIKSKCRGHSIEKIATAVALSTTAVSGVLSQCNTIVPSCLNAIPESDKTKIFQLDCYSVPAMSIPFIVDLTLQVVMEYLDIVKGKVSN